jgi:hypothetical protein
LADYPDIPPGYCALCALLGLREEQQGKMKTIQIVVLCSISLMLNSIALPLLDMAEAMAQVSRKLSDRADRLLNERKKQ